MNSHKSISSNKDKDSSFVFILTYILIKIVRGSMSRKEHISRSLRVYYAKSVKDALRGKK